MTPPASGSRPALSAFVITRNNERTIRRCIESLAFAGEIIVLDSGSTDRTLDICRELGAVVHTSEDWPGHGPQKNRALDRASGDWLLSLDSDEWISPALRGEIEHTLRTPGKESAYAVPRRSSFCGRFMKHSGWWPDYVVRLFRSGAARFSEDAVHERLIVTGTTRKLREPVLHEAIVDLDQMILKMNAYSTAGANMKLSRGGGASLVGAVWHGLWAFFRTYVLRLGFLDGREGFMLAVANAEGSYYRYVKLMLLERQQRNGARRPDP